MIVLRNATIVNLNPPEIKSGYDIIIEDSKIIEVGKNLSRKFKTEKVIDVNNKIVLAGLVCSHNHFYSSLARGITAKIKPSKNFVEILKNLWWKLDKALDEESLFYSGLIAAIESIKCGTTSVIDHNSSPSFIKNSLSLLKKSFEQVGLRGILCYEITDRNGKEKFNEAVEESSSFVSLIENTKSKNKNYLIDTAIGGHASFTLSNNSLKIISELIESSNRGFHIHAAEDKYDSIHSHKLYKMDIIKRFEKFNLLNDKTILAHGVNLNQKEIEVINKYNSFLVHNPRSNLNNNVGYLNQIGKIKNVCLGTDGIGSDMFDELNFAFFKNQESIAKIGTGDWLKILHNGNDILEKYFNKKFGRIEKGYTADILILNYNSPTPLTANNILGHLIFGITSKNVESVLINGKIVYENYQFPFEMNSIYNEAKNQAKKLWKKIDNE